MKKLTLLIFLVLPGLGLAQYRTQWKTVTDGGIYYGGQVRNTLVDELHTYTWIKAGNTPYTVALNGSQVINNTSPGGLDVLILKQDYTGTIINQLLIESSGSDFLVGWDIDTMYNKIYMLFQFSTDSINLNPNGTPAYEYLTAQQGAATTCLAVYNAGTLQLDWHANVHGAAGVYTGKNGNFMIAGHALPITDYDLGTGTHFINNPYTTYFLGKYDASGNLLGMNTDFYLPAGSMGASFAWMDMDELANGEILYMAHLQDSVYYNDGVTQAAYSQGFPDASGVVMGRMNTLCNHIMHFTYPGYIIANDLVVDENHNHVYIISRTFNALVNDYNPGPGTVSAAVLDDGFYISKFDLQLNYDRTLFTNLRTANNNTLEGLLNLDPATGKLRMIGIADGFYGDIRFELDGNINTVNMPAGSNAHFYDMWLDSMLVPVSMVVSPEIAGPQVLEAFFKADEQGGIMYHLTFEDSLDIEPFIANDGMIYATGGLMEITGRMGSFTPCTISGDVVRDNNYSGVIDTGDSPLAGIIFSVNGNNYTASTSNGTYAVYADTGSYTIAPSATSILYHTPVPASYTGLLNSANMNDTGKHFLFVPVPNIFDAVTSGNRASGLNPGFTHNYHSQVKNVGTEITSGTFKFLPSTEDVMVSASPAPTSTSGDTLIYSGISLVPGQTMAFKFVMELSATSIIGNDVVYKNMFVSNNTDTTPQNNNYIDTVEITGPYDPNMKEVSPDKNFYTSETNLVDQWLTYTIHFQNTGNDTAINVRVRDTLSTFTDAATFRILQSSHPATFIMFGNGAVDFNFNNIMLPDSNSSEPNSHGFVTYEIKLRNNQVIGNQIKNTAHIYFDFNAAIVTNTTLNEIITAAGLQEDEITENKHMLYPNPTNDYFSIASAGFDIRDIQTVSVYDINGKRVKEWTEHTLAYNIQNLKPGTYLVYVQTAKGNMASLLIKE